MRCSSVCCAAVDLGATSGRVITGEWDGGRLRLTEVHRFPNAFESAGGYDYWNVPGLWREIGAGLAAARQRHPKLASVGVATWGVDHVLTNDAGRIVFPVHAYRDARTLPGDARLTRRRAAVERLYAATGIPSVFFNTSLQLEETLTSCPAVADVATRCLLLPDYFNFLLSGKMHNEISAASTTQLLDIESGDWSRTALDYFHIPPQWFTPPIRAGRRLGKVRGIAGLNGVESVAVPGHDTACAYAAMPTGKAGDEFFISCGTWSLAGFESDRPVLGSAALAARVANERMGDGRYRPLRVLIGLWLLERTLDDFKMRPRNPREWDRLIAAAGKARRSDTPLDVTDAHFVNPPSMRAAIDGQRRRNRAPLPKSCAEYTRLICDSLGAAQAGVVRQFEGLSGRRFAKILLVGGGSHNRLLCQATADAAGKPVHAYALEATAVGNIGSQLVALGAVASTRAFRQALATQLKPVIYTPQST